MKKTTPKQARRYKFTAKCLAKTVINDLLITDKLGTQAETSNLILKYS